MSLNSYMSLDILNSTSNPLPFKITKALIKESLEELFSIECEGFFESLEQDLFSLNTLTNTSSHLSTPTTFNFHPNVLIDQEAILSIHNPYENNTLNFDNNEVKNYKGIITYIKYLGINHESALNINDLADLDTQRILVAKKEPTSSDKSWYNWYSDGWLEQGGQITPTNAHEITLPKPYRDTNFSVTATSNYKDTANRRWASAGVTSNTQIWVMSSSAATSASTTLCTWEAKGYANKPTIQDINITDGNNVRYPYFIQIATGLTTVVNIESDVQLNNPYTLGESKYSPIILNNLSWLSADIKDNTRELYPTYYDMLLDIYRGKKAVGGLTVKLSTDEDITRLDHVINLTNNTFNLPALNGTENGPIKSLNDVIDYKAQLTESPVLFVAPYNGWFYIEFPYEADKYVSLSVLFLINGSPPFRIRASPTKLKLILPLFNTTLLEKVLFPAIVSSPVV